MGVKKLIFIIASLICLNSIMVYSGMVMDPLLPDNISTNSIISLSSSFSSNNDFFSKISQLSVLSDGSSSKTLTFSNGENRTVYIKLLKNREVISAFLTLKTTISMDDTEDSLSYSGNFRSGYEYSNHADEDWNTRSMAAHAESSYIYETYNIYSSSAKLIWDAYRSECGSMSNTLCRAECQTSSGWTTIGSASTTDFSNRRSYFDIPSGCLSQNTLNLRYNMFTYQLDPNPSCLGTWGCVAYEAAVNWTNSFSTLEVGISDDSYEWIHSGSFNSEITSNLSNNINQYLSSCTADGSGYCLVPLTFNLPSGTIQILNVNVSYKDIDSCEICISSDNLCDTEWSNNQVSTYYNSNYLGGNCSYEWNTYNYNNNFYNISFRIKDSSNNYLISSKEIELDTADFMISSINLSDNYVKNNTLVTITVEVIDNNTITNITADNVSLIEQGNGIWAVNMFLIQKENNVVYIEIFDNSSNQSTERMINYFIDDEAPIIYSVELSNDQVKNNTSITISINVSDTNLSRVGKIECTSLNCQGGVMPLDFESGIYNQNITLTENLINITFSFWDEADNIKETILTNGVNFTIDNLAPIINDTLINLTLSSNSNGSITLDWNEDTNPDVVKYNIYRKNTTISAPVSINDIIQSNITLFTFTDTNNFNKNATYYYVLTAIDSAGNENLSAITKVVNITTSLDCSNDYTCGSWSTCSSSSQSRTCTRTCYLIGGKTSKQETQSCTSSSSSSSGGGGGGGSTSYLNLKLELIPANEESELTLDTSIVGLSEILLEVKEDIENTKITVKKLKIKPSGTNEPRLEEKVYKYIQIDKDFNNSLIKKAILKFEIEKSWLLENNVTKDQIKMFRFTVDWDELNTSISKEDNLKIYYEAESPGFSYFKISTIEEETDINEEINQEIIDSKINNSFIEDILENSDAESKNKTIIENKNEKIESNSFSKLILSTLLIIILLGTSFIYYYKKSKKKRKSRMIF